MEAFLLSLFCTLSRVPGLLLRYIPFRREATQKQKKILYLCYAAALSFNMILFWKAGKEDAMTNTVYLYSMFLFGLLMAGVNMLVIRGRTFEHMFTCGLNMCMVTMTITISSYLEKYCLDSTGVWRYIHNAWLMCLICFIAYPLFQLIIMHTVTPFLMIESQGYWRWIWPIPCLIYLACIFLLPTDYSLLTVNEVTAVVLLNGAAMIICFCITEDYQRLMERQQMDQQLNRQKEYYAELTNRVEETRKLRHDYKNHLMAIRGFVERNDKEGLLHYCDELNVPGVKNTVIPYTGNAAADGVLYHYMGLAEEKGIDFHFSGGFLNVRIDDLDLCVLLGNALDNAVTACKTIKEGRFINLAVSVEGDVLMIMVRNSYDGKVQEENGELLSRKRDHRAGVGLRSIKDICKKYQGSMQIQYQEKEFDCLMLLNQVK